MSFWRRKITKNDVFRYFEQCSMQELVQIERYLRLVKEYKEKTGKEQK